MKNAVGKKVQSVYRGVQGMQLLPRGQALCHALRSQPQPRTIRVASTSEERGRLSERVGIVIVDHGSRKKDSNDMLHEVCNCVHLNRAHEAVKPIHPALPLLS